MDKILFFDYIEENLKYSFLSQNIIIINKRNKLIYFTFIQVFFSIFGMIIFKLRRTIVFVYAKIRPEPSYRRCHRISTQKMPLLSAL